jgi:plasmid maintenance system antidote protein VapI
MGYIIATPGNVIDYDIIEETINTYHLHKVIEYDRYNATQLIQGCKSKALMFQFSQAIGTISAPTKGSKS